MFYSSNISCKISFTYESDMLKEDVLLPCMTDVAAISDELADSVDTFADRTLIEAVALS